MELDLLQERIDGNGSAEEPSLGIPDTTPKEELGLRFALNAFSDHLKVERMSHLNDVEDDLAGGAVCVDRLDEGFVDFERVERERLQAGETGVAGTEIVDGDAESLAT